ncbi:MAG: hypothetical protein AAB917_02510 [Patescibacteria group bacterium]
MSIKDWKEYLKFEKDKYKKLKCTKCPAIGYNEVHFNHYGFDHIVYKNGIPRPRYEVVNRFMFLSHVPKALKTKNSANKEEKRDEGIFSKHAYFWTIRFSVNRHLHLRIILRKLGDNGRIHFFSVMDE